MTEVSDEELFVLSLEENEEAKNELFRRNKYVIYAIIRQYWKIGSKLKIDYRDFYSEALYGFSDALANYNVNKQASFSTFIALCVKRRLQKALIKAGTKKNQLLAQSYSLDYLYDNNTFSDLIADSTNDPLKKIMNYEEYNELIKDLKNDLSKEEYNVFTFLANGFNYLQISQILGKSPKQIDNTINRIKNKIKLILETR